MAHRNCLHCGEPIVLVPSAAERARKSGGKPADYIAIFTVHAQCAIDARERGTRELIARVTCGNCGNAKSVDASQCADCARFESTKHEEI